jgi:hypothetical protein
MLAETWQDGKPGPAPTDHPEVFDSSATLPRFALRRPVTVCGWSCVEAVQHVQTIQGCRFSVRLHCLAQLKQLSIGTWLGSMISSN